jgi:hypothetical protein
MRQIFRTRHSHLTLWTGGLVLALALAPLGCNREPATVKVAQENEAPVLASVVKASAVSQEAQLLNGFYPIEANAWRWTARQFSVLLRTPKGAAEGGASLSLKFTLPQAAIDHSHSLTLTASVEGTPLKPETYSKADQYEYREDVPAAVLTKDAVRIQFVLDKAIPPTGADKRELGIIVSSVGLQAR